MTRWFRSPLPNLGLLLCLLPLAASSLRAQSKNIQSEADPKAPAPKPDPGPPPVFEVVSIKPDADPNGGSMSNSTATGMVMKNAQLDNLLRSAYGLPYTNDAQIVGLPPWAKKLHFDIDAKVAEEDLARYKNVTEKQRNEMTRTLLVDRFHLAAHLETKQGPVYELTIARTGSKLVDANTLSPAAEDAAKKDGLCAGCSMWSGNEIKAYAVPMESLLNMLMSASSRIVIDKTGLAGKYSFKLKWTPAEQADASGSSSDDTVGPSLFSAVQEQLGLRLTAAKGPVDDVVIDHIEEPSAN